MNKTTRNTIVKTILLPTGLFLALMIALTAPDAVRAGPGILFAAPLAQGSGDCSGWTNACLLQTALGSAAGGDEIWVRQGVHRPTTDPADRAATFTLKSGVALYGGFDGTEISRDQRDAQARLTVLSGDIDQNDLTGPAGVVTDTVNIQGANSYHVVTSGLTNNTALLDGFVITAGQATGAAPHDSGGGMFNYDSGPRLTHLVFSGNASSDAGGGMYNWNSHPTLTDVTLSGNSSASGGGMHNTHYSTPTLVRVTLDGNRATANGGGMANGGDHTSPVLLGVVFRNNTAVQQGGGIHNAMYNSNGGLLTDVIFSGNAAAEGGGMHNNNISPTVINAIFSDNAAAYGGGVYSYRSDLELINVTFTGNTASSQGGAMYSWWDRGPRLKNAILWGNSAPEGPEVYNGPLGNTLISYSNVSGCGGSGAGWNSACGEDHGGNIEADPLFVDAAGGDLRLQLISPAIDAGNNVAVPIHVTIDLDGNPRFADVSGVADTGNGDPPIVDMGAYEAQVNVTIGKSALPPVVEPGQAVAFALSVSNRGSITATDVIVTDTLPTFLTSVSFTSTLGITDTGHIPPYAWRLPPLLPGQGGVITVTGLLPLPLAAGAYTNTAVIAAEGDLLGDDNTTVITFTVPNLAPVFISTPVTTATQGLPYTYVAAAEDNNGDALTITAPTLPAWLTLTDHDGGTATLSGAPADAGDYGVVLHVSDGAGLVAEQSFVVAAGKRPAFRTFLPLASQNEPAHGVRSR